MINFLLGLLAGGLIAGIATISAARNPDVQNRLGLVPPAQAALALPAGRTEPRCPPSGGVSTDPRAAAKDLTAEMYFSRRRFWYVAPRP